MPDYTVGDTVYKRFTTRAFATGIPGTLGGVPVVSAYEDDSITQITAGITLGVDHDSVAGLNLLTIVATGGNGFESGKSYDFVITTGTVGGDSVVGEVVWHFTLSAEAAFTRIGVNGAGLSNIDLPNQTMDIVGNITGNLSGSVNSVTNDVGITAAAVNLIYDEAMVETTGAPAVTGTFRAAWQWMFALSRSKVTQTVTEQTLRNDADSADLSTATTSDDGSTYTRNKWST